MKLWVKIHNHINSYMLDNFLYEDQMYSAKFLLSFVMVLLLSTTQLSYGKKSLFIYSEDNRYGYIDNKGEVSIAAQFDDAGQFSENLAWVKIGGQIGFINKKGKIVVNPQFKEHVRKKAVNVTTLDKLIDKYDVKHIDYLKLDIEGMEWAILQDYTWKIKPKKIKCEYVHWENHGIVLGDYVKMLEHMGYTITMLEEDFIAVHD